MALSIGSDCPFFLDGDPAFARGRGEILEPFSSVLAGYYLLLLNPGVRIDTGEAYRNCRPVSLGTGSLQLEAHDIPGWKDQVVNDFEEFAFKRYPVIGKIKNDLYRYRALFSLMSGSGSSVYGIFSGKPGRIPRGLRKYVIWEGLM
jgi:4-diphosphocytidyl-2-C-methyl-D-erythritol kinase